MSEYIDREAAYEVLTEYYHHSTEFQHLALKDALARVPAADVVERKTGKWTLNKDGSATCSECGRVQQNAWDMDNADNFCHFCGARMEYENGEH